MNANNDDSFQPIPGLGSGVEVRRSARRKRTISAHREGENVDEAFARVYKFVEDKLIEKMQEIEKELKA